MIRHLIPWLAAAALLVPAARAQNLPSPTFRDVTVMGTLNAAPVMQPVPRTVLIGGVGAGFATLANAANNAQMLAAGTIGIYEHANGIAPLTPAQRAAIYTTWGLPVTGQRQTVGEVGAFPTISTGYLGYFGGIYPVEVNMNVTADGTYTSIAGAGDAQPGQSYTGFFSTDDLTAAKTAIAAANAAGAQSVAPFLTPNGGGEDLVDPFATSAFYANERSAIAFGGALGLDVPPSYYLSRGAAYQSMIAQKIIWANSQGYRTSLTVSPYAVQPDAAGNTGNCGFDPAFAEATQVLEANLGAAGAEPTQWVVEEYGPAGPGCGTSNDVASDTTPESLNAVALYLARVRTPHAPGTARAGANGIAEAGLLARPMPVPIGRMGLPVVSVGPLRIGDIVGLPPLSMGYQSSDNVRIGGGSASLTNLTVSNAPIMLNGVVVQGSSGVIYLDANGATQTLNVEKVGGGYIAMNVSGTLNVAQALTAGSITTTGSLLTQALNVVTAPTFQSGAVVQGVSGIVYLDVNGASQQLRVEHVNGGPADLYVEGDVSGHTITATGMPTSDPHVAGKFWHDANNAVFISTGP